MSRAGLVAVFESGRRPDRAAMLTTTLTFGEVAENGPNMQKLGRKAPEGLTLAELRRAHAAFAAAGCECALVDLLAAAELPELPGEAPPEPAYVLVVRGGAALLAAGAAPPDSATGAAPPAAAPPVAPPAAASATAAPVAAGPGARTGFDAVAAEQKALTPDKKAIFRGEVKNKKARWNLTFGDVAQEPDYEMGRGRVVPFAALPALAVVRAALPAFFGPKASQLLCEANYYHSPNCGIGPHGDTERRIAIGLRIATVRFGATIPLHFHWYLRWNPVGKRIAFEFRDGDLYAMSHKAVGTDWRRPSVLTLRHAAGAPKYLVFEGK